METDHRPLLDKTSYSFFESWFPHFLMPYAHLKVYVEVDSILDTQEEDISLTASRASSLPGKAKLRRSFQRPGVQSCRGLYARGRDRGEIPTPSV